MFITPQERQLQRELDRFWYQHYTKQYSTKMRSALAKIFTEKWLFEASVLVTKPFIRHPATKHRRFNREFTVSDVLADFIMRIDQVEERTAEYPIYNADKQLAGERARRSNERSIFYQGEEDALDKEAGESVPAYSVTESEFEQKNSAEDVLFREEAPCVGKFRKELRHVKKYAEFYATTFAEEYGFEKKDALRLIRKLDLARIYECEVCHGAFYRHDMRTRYCDCQKDEGKKLSTCQHQAKKMVDLIRIKSII